MGNVFTLDSLREEVEREFAPIEIIVADGSTITLRNLLRLSKSERDVVVAKLKVLESIDSDAEASDGSNEIDALAETAAQILVLVADRGEKLIEELDGDVSVILKVLNKWMESTQPGEAQPSPA